MARFHATALGNLQKRIEAAPKDESLRYVLESIHSDLEEQMLAAGVVTERRDPETEREMIELGADPEEASFASALLFYVPDAPGAKDGDRLRLQYELCTQAIDEEVRGRGPLLKALGMVKPRVLKPRGQ